MKNDKWLVIGVAALLVTVFLGATLWYRKSQREADDSKVKAHSERLVRPYSQSIGPPNAPVTIVEFFDPECEACRAIYPMVKEVIAQYPGKVRLVLRYMPLHHNAAFAAAHLEAARKQGKYWEALEALFLHQPEWGSHHAPKPELIPGYLQKLGLDMEQIKASAEDNEIQSRIKQDHEDGIHLGVNRTPTFFVNGDRLQQLGYKELREAIDGALKK